jgi:hypothetical protein
MEEKWIGREGKGHTCEMSGRQAGRGRFTRKERMKVA